MKQILLYVLLAGSVALAEDAAPTFPLKTPAILAVADKQPDDVMSAMIVEQAALLDIFSVIKDLPDLETDGGTKFADLMRFPEKHRGEIVRVKGSVAHIEEFKVRENKLGLSRVWRAIVASPPAELYSILVLEEPKLNSQVDTRGCFLKRHTFLNNMDGNKATWTPLVFARRLRLSTENPTGKLDPEQLRKLPRENDSSSLVEPASMRIHLHEVNKVWCAEFNGVAFSLEKQNLPEFVAALQARVDVLIKAGEAQRQPDGSLSTTVNFKIHQDAPMTRVEAAVLSLARVGLFDIQYLKLEAPRPAQPPAQQLENAIPLRKLKLHLSQTEKLIYELDGNPLTRAHCLEALKTASRESQCQLRISYDPNVPYSGIMDAFKLGEDAGISECGLVPGRK